MDSGNRGGGIVAVMLVSAALAVGIYSVLALVNGENRRNHKALLYQEAKLGAESLLQSGLADLQARFDSQATFPENSLIPSGNPLEISDEFAGRYASSVPASNLLIPAIDKRKYTSTADFDADSEPTELIGGKVIQVGSPGELTYIDPRIPGNEDDRLAGAVALVRNVELISRASVERPGAGGATVHARQVLQVRDAPLFAYAIFYNLPMEIAPNSPMLVDGKVHSNGDTWLQSGSRLEIEGRLTVAGDLYHGRHPDSAEDVRFGKVTVLDGTNSAVNMEEDSSWPEPVRERFNGDWLDSSEDDFTELSGQLWDGNLQTSSHGVAPLNVVGVSDYQLDDPSTSADETYNPAYALIQPPLPQSELSVPSAGSDGYDRAVARMELERQKFSYNAGLTIRVDASGNLSYVTYDRQSDGSLKYGADGKPVEIALTPTGLDRDSDTATAPDPVARHTRIDASGAPVPTRVYDERQRTELDIVEVDVEVMKELLHGDGNSSDDWGKAPDEWWNGVVYVEFPQKNASSSRDDGVNPAVDGWGVRLVNGSVIPNPGYSSGKGTTFATNQMMYVQGHFNADGNLSTGSSSEPDDPSNFGREGHEAPAALVADSVTLLSEDWDDAASIADGQGGSAVDTEVSAAILTGVVPTGGDGGGYSGGVENLPRLLENWSGQDLRIRGSMVALYESEVGSRGWSEGAYVAPTRDWGFHERFALGDLPPWTPMVRDYRATDFEIVTEAEYAALRRRIAAGFTSVASTP